MDVYRYLFSQCLVEHTYNTHNRLHEKATTAPGIYITVTSACWLIARPETSIQTFSRVISH